MLTRMASFWDRNPSSELGSDLPDRLYLIDGHARPANQGNAYQGGLHNGKVL
jgi:hypothetical protein